MRIAIINDHPHKIGGVNKYIAEIAKRLCHLHEVHIFAQSSAYFENPKVIFHNVPVIKGPWLLTLLSFIINSTVLIKLSGRFDIIHSQGASSLIQNVVTNHVTYNPAYRIYEACGVAENYYFGENFLKKALRKLLYSTNKLLVCQLEKQVYGSKSKRKIIAVSEGVKREINEYYDKPSADITVIHNGVDLEKFNPSKKNEYRKFIRSKFNIKEEDFTLLFVGANWENKGLDLLIKALSLLNDPSIRLLIAGQWKKTYCEALVNRLQLKEQVIFAGETDQPEMFYGAADLFVLPSYYEACSLPLLEAAASSLPILTTRTNGSQELIIDGENGYLISHSPEDISSKIRYLLNNKEKMEETGRKIRRKLEEEGYSWDTTAKLLAKLYEEAKNSH